MKCVSKCDTNHSFLNGTKCVAHCPYYTDANGVSSCVTQCPVGYFFLSIDNTTKHCVSTCPAEKPYVDKDKSCKVTCPSKLYALTNGTLMCIDKCSLKKHLNATSKTSQCVASCPVGTTLVKDQCISTSNDAE